MSTYKKKTKNVINVDNNFGGSCDDIIANTNFNKEIKCCAIKDDLDIF